MASEGSKGPTIEETTLGPIYWAWRLSLHLIFIWFFAVVVQALWIYTNDKTVDHVVQVIDAQIAASPEGSVVRSVAMATDDLLFDRLGARKLLTRVVPHNDRDAVLTSATKRLTKFTNRNMVLLACYETVLFAVRMGTLLTLLPLIIIVMATFAIDGLVEREIRRACGGLESATIYHRAKRLNMRIMVPLLSAVYLCNPVYVNVLAFLLPALLLSAFALRLQLTYYKKHL